MVYNLSKKLLFLDLETNSLDTEEADIKFVGCMDETGEEWMAEWSEETRRKLQDKIEECSKVITFNGVNYDLPILKRFGVDVPYWQHIDLYEVYKKRAPLIKSGGFRSYSLKNIVKEIGVKTDGKGDIDYKIFQKNKWTKEEYAEMYKYLKQDLVITKQLWDYLILKFENLKEFLNRRDQNNYKHITSSTGAYGYKVICHALGLKEEYVDGGESAPYEGAYVMTPQKEVVRGDVLYLDFASLYPMLYIHSNLFSTDCDCCTEEEKWQGNDMFKINGKYCSKKQGKMEELIKKFYLQRKEYKKVKDPRQFAIKIIINSIYGTSSRPSFKHLYSKFTASDCTSLARQSIAYAIKELDSHGYTPLYADTDSCLVELNGKPKDECLILAKKISKDISNAFPFPWEEFDLKLEDEIKYIQFFKDKTGKLIKKNYIYINKKNEMTIKGMDIIKRNCSELGQQIFKKNLQPQILEKKDCLFSKEYIDGLITEAINKNKLIIAKRFNIKDSEYKSKTSIYSLIKDKYGPGEIMMIKNKSIGAGKGVKYCSLEEASKLAISDLDLEDIYKEMGPFIKNYHEIKLEEAAKVREERKILRKKLREEAKSIKEDKAQASLF